MITKNVTLTVKENTAKLSSKLFLFKNDGNIRFVIDIKGLNYTFDSEQFICSCIIQKPDKSFLKYDNMEVNGTEVYLTFEPSMIDELSELGKHTVQLMLHSTVLKDDRLTLPSFEIEVLRGLGD